MDTEQAKDLIEIFHQLRLSRNETVNTMDTVMRGFVEELRLTRKLWRRGNKSFLIRVGLALIAFPEPTITDVLGSALVAADIIQLKIKNSTLYIEDVYKTFPKLIRELGAIKQCLV